MQTVLNQYIKAISNQGKRRERQGRDAFTSNENKAIEFYGQAAQQISALIIQGPTSEDTCQPQR
jgi:hypothetical protein